MSLKSIDPPANIGIIGLGAIGKPIAQNIHQAGFDVKLYSKNLYLRQDSFFKDVICSEDPKSVSKDCAALIICVSDDQAVSEVLFGKNGAIDGLNQNTIVIDLSTISPKSAESNFNLLAKRKIHYLDAPVTGGTEAAYKGELTILIGGDKNVFNQVYNLLNTIGKNIYHFGTTGNGQRVKAINQILVAGTYASVAEAVSIGQGLKLPMEEVISALNHGAAGSWALKNRSKSMIEDHYPLGFKLSLHHKDLIIALKLAHDLGIDLPITSKVKNIEEELISNGYENYDVSVLRKSLKPN